MFTLRAICLFFVFAVAHADDSKVFTNTPDFLPLDETIAVVKQAALKRKWLISKHNGNELEIKLDTSDFRSKLQFTFFKQQIRYIGHAVRGIEDDSGDETEVIWESSRVPRKWLRNLTKDVQAQFASQSKFLSNKTKIFTYAPESVSVEDIISVLKYVSEKRRWVVSKQKRNLLQVQLNQTNYIAMLEFSIRGNEIGYTDLTKIFRETLPESESNNTKVPPNWLLNLKNDLFNVFPFVQQLKTVGQSTSLENQNTSPSVGTKLLADIPASITAKNAIDVLRYVSINRKWVTTRTKDNVLSMQYERNDYKAHLDFIIVDNEIRYTDLTRKYVDIGVNKDTEKSDAPRNWIANLKRDLKTVFPFAQSINSHTEVSSQPDIVTPMSN